MSSLFCQPQSKEVVLFARAWMHLNGFYYACMSNNMSVTCTIMRKLYSCQQAARHVMSFLYKVNSVNEDDFKSIFWRFCSNFFSHIWQLDKIKGVNIPWGATSHVLKDVTWEDFLLLKSDPVASFQNYRIVRFSIQWKCINKIRTVSC